MTITRGGRSFFIEINDAPAGEEMNFSCKLLPEDPWIDEEEASKVPLLIFSHCSWARSAGEQKIRDTLNPPEDTAAAADDAWDKKDSWEQPADKWGKQDAKPAWEDKAADKWASSGKEEKSWEKPAEKSWEKPADSWGNDKKDECGDFKKGRCTRGDKCRFSHDIPGYEDTAQEWSGNKQAPAWGQEAPAEKKWDNGRNDAPAAAWGNYKATDSKAADSNDKWGKKDTWDEPATDKWGKNGSSSNSWEKPAENKSWEKPAENKSWEKPADPWGQKQECGDFKRGRCTRGDQCRFSHDNPGYAGAQEWNGNGAVGAKPVPAFDSNTSPWDGWTG